MTQFATANFHGILYAFLIIRTTLCFHLLLLRVRIVDLHLCFPNQFFIPESRAIDSLQFLSIALL